MGSSYQLYPHPLSPAPKHRILQDNRLCRLSYILSWLGYSSLILIWLVAVAIQQKSWSAHAIIYCAVTTTSCFFKLRGGSLASGKCLCRHKGEFHLCICRQKLPRCSHHLQLLEEQVSKAPRWQRHGLMHCHPWHLM
jgi:hypothetical protein